MARLPATKEEARRTADGAPAGLAAGQRWRSLEGVDAQREGGDGARSANATARTGCGSTASRTLSRDDKSVEYICVQDRGSARSLSLRTISTAVRGNAAGRHSGVRQQYKPGEKSYGPKRTRNTSPNMRAQSDKNVDAATFLVDDCIASISDVGWPTHTTIPPPTEDVVKRGVGGQRPHRIRVHRVRMNAPLLA